MSLAYPCDTWRWLYNVRVCSDVLFSVSPNIPRICVIHQDPRFVTVKLLLKLKVCAHSGYYPSSESVVTKNHWHSLHTMRLNKGAEHIINCFHVFHYCAVGGAENAGTKHDQILA